MTTTGTVNTTATRFQPMHKRLLVERSEEKSAGGIIIPDTSKTKPSRGIIRAVSKDVTTVSEGAEIIFGRYSGVEIKLDQKDYLILREDEVFGVIQ